MKPIKLPKLEFYSFLFSMPLIAIILNLILFDGRLWTDAKIWLISVPLIFSIGTVMWFCQIWSDQWAESTFPTLPQSSKRIATKIAATILIVTAGVLMIFFLYNHYQLLNYAFHQIQLTKALVVVLSVSLIFETLYEADYIFGKYKESTAEKDAMTQMASHQEFDTLKSQVNPHFLFNCFNTLSSLISFDKERASQFLDELSKVYRYLLRNNQEGVTTVESEIKFIQSYFQLLQTRYGESVQLNVQIEKHFYRYLLPSLTLQLLVENVVKHNALSKSKPLVIDIFTAAGNKLVVNNNLQRRTVKALSNGIGLQNIQAKYQLLNQPGFQVIEDDKNFTVVLPLIWKSNVGEKDSRLN